MLALYTTEAPPESKQRGRGAAPLDTTRPPHDWERVLGLALVRPAQWVLVYDDERRDARRVTANLKALKPHAERLGLRIDLSTRTFSDTVRGYVRVTAERR